MDKLFKKKPTDKGVGATSTLGCMAAKAVGIDINSDPQKAPLSIVARSVVGAGGVLSATIVNERPKTPEPLLSSKLNVELMESLADALEDSSLKSVRSLLNEFNISAEEQLEILRYKPCDKFFVKLALTKPELTLKKIKEDVEKLEGANPMIFRDMREEKGAPFTLSETLKSVTTDTTKWVYFWEKVGLKLVQPPGSELVSWQQIATHYCFHEEEIKAFEDDDKNANRPTIKLLKKLCEKDSKTPLASLLEKLRKIKREDVAKMIE